MNNNFTRLITISMVASASLFGAAPTISEAIKQTEQPKPAAKPTPIIPQIGKAVDDKVPAELKSGKKILVKRFAIFEADNMSVDELKKIVAPYENKELTFAQMQEVASLITKAYRAKGYFVARAYIPEQDILTQDGRLKINVVEGKYGKFNLKNDSLNKDCLVQGQLDSIKPYGIVSTDTLERAMLIINDTPGSSVIQADVTPGSVVGTSDFTIATVATPRYSGYGMLDNYGSRYTGKHKLSAGADINAPFRIGDKLSLSFMGSENKNLLNGKIAYSAPLAYNGLRGEIAASKTTYTLGDSYRSLDALGESKSIEATISYPIKRTRAHTITTSLNIADKWMVDNVRSTATKTNKSAKVATASIDSTKDSVLFGFDGSTNMGMSVTMGRLGATETTTNGGYAKLNANIARQSVLSQNLSLSASLKIQKSANKNLDGSEDMTVTGTSGVRSFVDGEFSAENGYVASIELLRALPAVANISSKAGLFVDNAKATYQNNTTTGSSSRTFSDIGLGYYGYYKTYNAKLQVAKRVGGETQTSEKDSDTRVLWQVGVSY